MVTRKTSGGVAFFFGSSAQMAHKDVKQRMSDVSNTFTITQRSTIECSAGAGETVPPAP